MAGFVFLNTQGRIAGVTRVGLFVKLDDTGADGFIPAATLGDDYFRYDEASHALVGMRSGETHQLGDRVEVRLIEVAPMAGALRFELMTEGRMNKGTSSGGKRFSGAAKFKPRERAAKDGKPRDHSSSSPQTTFGPQGRKSKKKGR